MRTERATFFSDGLRLSGAFFLPDEEPGPPQPLVIPCSGFTGLCCIHPARFARYLTGRGFQCFGFDYRGFAESEGQRGRVLLEEQVRDILAAVALAASNPRVDASRIVLLGWGMGAGLVLDAARELPGIAGLIAANGFYNGRRFQKAHRGEEGYRRFVAEIARERAERVHTGQPRQVDPFDLYPLDPQSRRYVDDVLRKAPGYDTEAYSFELAESLVRWRPEAHGPHMKLPLLIAHGDDNRLHLPEEAESLHSEYAGPKELYWVENGGHTEWMLDEDPRFQTLGARICDWLDDLLA